MKDHLKKNPTRKKIKNLSVVNFFYSEFTNNKLKCVGVTMTLNFMHHYVLIFNISDMHIYYT